MLLAILATVQSFMPSVARTTIRSTTIVMDGKSNGLKDRIRSIKNTRRITEAMRFVAAARVRRAQEAVLKTRPLIGQLQMVGEKSHYSFSVQLCFCTTIGTMNGCVLPLICP